MDPIKNGDIPASYVIVYQRVHRCFTIILDLQILMVGKKPSETNLFCAIWVFPKNRGGPPKSSIVIGFSL